MPAGRLELTGVMSMPIGRAPRRASQAEMYAVPQPSSIDVQAVYVG